ncbi:MAG: NAD-dependent epimerase/dehydratase family protein [Euzebya sp.]
MGFSLGKGDATVTGQFVDVAVLGATGFIGSRLCRRLTDAGLSVRAVARRLPASQGAVQPHLLPLDPGPGDWINAVDGARCVINLVGVAHFAGPDDEMIRGLFATNVVTTGTITQACARASVERVVYLSSIKAIAESSSTPLASNGATAPTTTYGGTKLAGELLTAAVVGEECSATVVRVPMVYGVAARGNLGRIARGVKRGMPFPRLSHEGLRSIVSLERLVLALQELADTERPPHVLHVCDPEPIVFSDIVSAIADGLGLPVRLVPLPTPFLSTALGAIGRRDTVQRWTHDLLMRSDQFEDHPPTSTRNGTLAELSAVARTFG